MIDSVLKILDKWVPDQEERLKLKIDLESQFNDYSKRDHELRIKEMEHKGFKSWWRPFLMFSFGSIVVLYCIIYYLMPGILEILQLEDFLLLDLTEPEVDPALWDLVKYSILGIGGMRTVDKWRTR